MGEKSYPREAKLTKNCPRGVKLAGKKNWTKLLGGSQEKKHCDGGKQILFCVRGGKENTRFCHGVEKIPIFTEGVKKNFLPPLLFF